MSPFEVVAHRGAASGAAENTISAFERALELGADAIEFDVRLTGDFVPVIHHFYSLGSNASASGTIFSFTWEQLRLVRLRGAGEPAVPPERIPALEEVLTNLGGRIGLEIHLQGPEPESPIVVGDLLQRYRDIWDTIEVTSYEPAALLGMRRVCPGLATDLLYPRSEPWKTSEIVQHEAIHYGRMAQARAVHLHPSQLTAGLVNAVRERGMQVHAWDVNDAKSLGLVAELGIPRLDTDHLEEALAFRGAL